MMVVLLKKNASGNEFESDPEVPLPLEEKKEEVPLPPVQEEKPVETPTQSQTIEPEGGIPHQPAAQDTPLSGKLLYTP